MFKYVTLFTDSQDIHFDLYLNRLVVAYIR